MSTKSKWTGQNLTFFDDKYNTSVLAGPWADAPVLPALIDPSIAHTVFEDFNDIDAATLAGWTATQATAGTWAIADATGGEALADSGSTTQHQGINVQKLGECFTPAANKDIWFECRFKVVDTYDKAQIFVGLAETDTTLMPSGDLDSTNTEYVGFGIETTGAGALKIYGCKATAEDSDAAATIAEATYIKVAFKITGLTKVEHWINDVKGSTTLVTANIPTNALTPSFVCQTDGTNDPILHVDYVRCMQLR